ncbi:DUF5998 family protein [Nesterenkonia sphaerica]|uniref:Cell wall biosynthesis glycosyltransferase n=1 Tax=Nesterenkonia sphaerica TaxID=1804988 RepID=A0A5R9AMX2_9MICC|nr:DUF5998 family protein [Nesterenkonia sphaerica]TLP79484.1 cell wall biosynthesis glycosyltransferase [Nesterenkonia sphaerica]
MGTSTVSLKEAIDRGGFYPTLVHHTVTEALDGRPPEQQIVHVDTHFDFEEVHRHITVLVLAEDVMVVAHLDDHDAEEDRPFQHEDSGPSGPSEVVARISTEVVPVVRLRSLILSEVHRRPDEFRPDRGLAEVSLNINWTGSARFDAMPADCGNPECVADHGETGTVVPEDVSLRIAATAEGDTAVDEARSFVRALRRATVKYSR